MQNTMLRPASRLNAALDSVLSQSVARGAAPYLVAMVGNAAGVLYSGAAGEHAPGKLAGEDTLFRLFSMTKAIGQFAAMMLCDRGLLDFDTPVEEILPEFADMRVLDGFDGDRPILRVPRQKATVRHLATHTSGIAYESWSHEATRYAALVGLTGPLSGTRDFLRSPMLFDPGTRWHYGHSTDWLGLVVEKIVGRPMNLFVTSEIFEPLGMTGAMFDVPAAALDRLPQKVSQRNAEGSFDPVEINLPYEPEFYGMGQAIHATAPDYLRFLRMLLNKGELDGHRIISAHAVDRMFENAIGHLVVPPLATFSDFAADINFFPTTRKTHSLFGVRVEEDVRGMRRAGSQFWSGYVNTHFWIDPASDIAAVLMTQSLPFADRAFMDAFDQFEQTVYAG